jgi:hypothetical protein
MRHLTRVTGALLPHRLPIATREMMVIEIWQSKVHQGDRVEAAQSFF